MPTHFLQPLRRSLTLFLKHFSRSAFYVLGPTIPSIINFCWMNYLFCAHLAEVIVYPLRKKPSINPGDLSGYWTISTLNFASKVLELVVLVQGLPLIWGQDSWSSAQKVLQSGEHWYYPVHRCKASAMLASEGGFVLLVNLVGPIWLKMGVCYITTGQLTSVTIDKDVLMARVMFIVIYVSNDDGQRVGATDCWMTTVLHDYRKVVLLLFLPVKCP